ncbi:lipoyl domain-containing protein [Nonomuraea sp. NPDC050663]|uniref:lipoyl domain-containing protein n=1 Tax=Nonomuraea sp. NPDC050663 TaxID=3364370 RepID=UPI00378BCA49
MFEVTVPKLNSNDVNYTLTAWLVEDGHHVEAGDPLVEVETSKAVSGNRRRAFRDRPSPRTARTRVRARPCDRLVVRE